MGVILDYEDVRKQSQAVWNQFGESKWIPYTQINNRLPNRRDPWELQGSGVGKFAVLAAMGASIEKHVDILKKYRDRFDLITCDKGFGMLLEHGLKADYVQLCDCNIQYKWIEPYINETVGVKLLATTYANVEWTTKWRGPIYLYTNKDALQSERKFLPIMGQPDLSKLGFTDDSLKIGKSFQRVIPAGSNVSNAMLIFMVGVDEELQTSFAGYEHFFLTGYDYSWKPFGDQFTCKTGNYYAFANPMPKRFYMNHRTMIDVNGDPIQTSENLLFSAKWLYSYITAYKLPVTNCSEAGILEIPNRKPLEECLSRIRTSPQAVARIRKELGVCQDALSVLRNAQDNLNESRRALWA